MTLEVRDVRPEELAEAGAVTVAAYAEFVRPGDADWQAYVEELRDVATRAARAVVLVAAEEPDGILGTVTLELSSRIDDDFEPLEPDRAHVRMLAVRPDVRRRGVARALMEACADRARAAGKTRLTLHTTERMVAAQAMYQRLGFARSEDQVFPNGFVLLGYELEL
ncbi:MAG: GNAT family N-acetyltransferase [Actinomycetota bacterium]|nr:GNAT family N-acetyltransferase [Actinomycetota bacterium]